MRGCSTSALADRSATQTRSTGSAPGRRRPCSPRRLTRAARAIRFSIARCSSSARRARARRCCSRRWPGAASVHDRRRESPADRGPTAAQPGVARVRIEPPDRPRTRRRRSSAKLSGSRFFEALRDRDGQRPPRGQPRAHAGEDAEELVAGAVSRAGLSRGAVHLPVSRSAAGAFQHDRGLDARAGFGPIRSCPAGPARRWSLLLVPGWRELIGRPLHEIVAAQWRTPHGC